jgi:hypothetical protein
MQWKQRCSVFVLLMLTLFSGACGKPAPPAPTPTPVPSPSERFLKHAVPKNWADVSLQRLDADPGALNEEWAVFHRAGAPSEHLTDAVVFRLSTEGPPTASAEVPSFVAYDLDVPGEEHLCECECVADRFDLLSAYEGTELLIWDKCNGELTKLFAYHWITESLEYELLMRFDGDLIQVELDRVAVDNRCAERVGLALRCVYSAPEGGLGSDGQQAGDSTPVLNARFSSQCECIFVDGLPDDVLASPYPEVVVLSLYHQFDDADKIRGYFTADAWDSQGRFEVGRYGCSKTHSPIVRVRVTGVDVGEDRCVREACVPDSADVKADIVCEHEDGSRQAVRVEWSLQWEGSGWRLSDRAE